MAQNGLNKCMFIGRLGFDAELKATTGGQSLLKFKIACSESYKGRDGVLQEKTEWVPCLLWGPRAEGLSRYMLKGGRVYVEGRIQTRSWETDDGQKRSITECNVKDVILLGEKGGEARAPKGNADWKDVKKGDEKWAARENADVDLDDIPF